MLQEFQDWDTLYKTERAESLPWYSKNLDHDLVNELKKRKINEGKFLDLGTGPATQALQLSGIGFDVTATDISAAAIARAKKLSDKIIFIVDDITNSKLDEKFDYIFDRGCFHTLNPADRKKYVKTVKNLLNKNGFLFLKCFSTKQPGDWGPHRFSKKDIENIFSSDFSIESIKDTIFEGTLNDEVKALFAVMRKE
jgi:cyclopropane fatty-acyl-phospholipid synthase-like methyltransferase